MKAPVRLDRRLTLLVILAGLLSATAIGTRAIAAPSASNTAGLQLTIGITNRGPLTSCALPPGSTTPCPLASTTQFLLYVHNGNALTNFVGPPTPDRTTIPNAFVLSSVDQSATIDGQPCPGCALTATPPPNAQFPAGSGRWPSTVVCTPSTGPPPCATVESPAILPGETTAAFFIGWTHGSTEQNGKYIFTFVLHGSLNGQPIDLTASSPTIVMKTSTALGWAPAAPMPTTRSYLAAATGHDGRIYAIGGLDAGGNNLDTVEAYTPSTNTWATVAPMPTARQCLAAVTGSDGRIYAIGGSNATSNNLTTVEAYTPSTDTWTTAAPMPTGRECLAAAAGTDGRIYAIGGVVAGTATSFNTVEAYTPSTNTWATVAPMPTARWGIAAATGPDGRIYVVGGQTDLTTVEAYAPGPNTWATVASMSTGRYTPAAATGPDGRVYVMGGDNNYTALSSVEAYTTSSDTWAAVQPMLTGRRGLAAATGLDGRIYAIGGTTGEGHTPTYVNTVEAYTPGSVTAYPIPTSNSQPNDITTGPDGALWFTEFAASQIGRITTAGAFKEFTLPVPSSSSAGCFGGSSVPSNGPDYIRAGSDSALWFTESTANKIGRITTQGHISEFSIPTAESFPLGIAAGPDGALWFTEACGNNIGRITTSGAITEFNVPTVNSGPNSIVAGPDGALWFTERNVGKIGRMTTSGSITEFDVSASFTHTAKIASGPDGALWFSGDASQLGRLTTGGSLTTFPIANPAMGITTGPDGALWFSEPSADKIGRLTTDGGYIDFAVAPSSWPQNPTSGPDGAIWFVEFQANSVGRLGP